jgi:hypothetical protein
MATTPDPLTTEWVPLWSTNNYGALYTHVQSTPALTWTITHNLGVIGFAVTITDNAGAVVLPDTLTYTSANVVTVTFAVAQAGKAYVLGGNTITGIAPGLHHATHEPGGSDPLAALSASALTTGTVPDARLSANVPLKNTQNTFTTNQIVNAPNPTLIFTDTAAPADARVIYVANTGQRFAMAATKDDYTGGVGILTVNRAGDVYAGRDIYEKGRTVPMGHWISAPFVSTAPELVGTFQYALVGKLCFVTVHATGTLPAPIGYLRITLPVGAYCDSAWSGKCFGNAFMYAGAGWEAGFANPSNNTIDVWRNLQVAWAAQMVVVSFSICYPLA